VVKGSIVLEQVLQALKKRGRLKKGELENWSSLIQGVAD